MNAEEARKVLKGIRVDNDDEFHAIKIAREALAQRKTTKWVDDGYAGAPVTSSEIFTTEYERLAYCSFVFK